MPILCNPEIKQVTVHVGRSKVVMTLRTPNASEFSALTKPSIRVNKKTGVIDDISSEKKLRVFNDLLVDIAGFDEDDKPEKIEYLKDGVACELTSKTENWKYYIPEQWKEAACLIFTMVTAEEGDTTAKN